jgi:hypothetical protein
MQLDLGGSLLEGRGGRSIAKALTLNKTLTKIGSRAVDVISEAARANKTLKEEDTKFECQ